MLAGACKIAGGCAKYAASSWSPGGLGILVIIIIVIVLFLRRK